MTKVNTIVREEWLVLRRDCDGKGYYALSNASVETPLPVLATRKCQRFFIERANQDAKSELGWDENPNHEIPCLAASLGP